MSDVYCTVRDIERFLSTAGVDSFADHDFDGYREAGVVDDAIQFAAAQIRNALCSRYESSSLVGNETVREWNMILAARRVCSSRANPIPDTVELRYQEAVEAMRMIGRGDGSLCGVLQKSTNVPTWSNLRVDRRYDRERIRVVKETSSPIGSDLEQDAAPVSTDRGRRID